ncbi:hypothetical protein PBY51_020838 [Eleginops maclovinus]|nr:hypothetical protein PBY51_023948 [Eleginops maclovinus]KAK5855581.1 hypothetical protein PBY51_007245 [Eleginops maclovinus]KAK5866667.1 hypothetical protein PBY51_020838 [Eleginops maclovinus]
MRPGSLDITLSRRASFWRLLLQPSQVFWVDISDPRSASASTPPAHTSPPPCSSPPSSPPPSAPLTSSSNLAGLNLRRG